MATTSLISTGNVKKAAASTADYARNNTQTLLVLAALGVGGYVVYKAITGINKIGENIFNNPDPSTNQQSGSGNTLPPPGSGATITQNQAANIAAGLLYAMDTAGTDEEMIFKLLKGKTPQDFTLISNAFGTPRYTDFGKGTWPFPERNLTYWLNAELDRNDMAKLKTLMPGVL